jgi:hypothetical protein
VLHVDQFKLQPVTSPHTRLSKTKMSVVVSLKPVFAKKSHAKHHVPTASSTQLNGTSTMMNATNAVVTKTVLKHVTTNVIHAPKNPCAKKERLRLLFQRPSAVKLMNVKLTTVSVQKIKCSRFPHVTHHIKCKSNKNTNLTAHVLSTNVFANLLCA